MTEQKNISSRKENADQKPSSSESALGNIQSQDTELMTAPRRNVTVKLVKSIREEDRDAFKDIYRKYNANLCEFAFWMVNNREDAEDLVHEVFLNIWENRHTWEATDNVRSYLYRSVKNKSLNYLRHQSVVKKWEDMSKSIESASPASPEDNLLENELKERIHSAINSLPERRRKIFLLNRNHKLRYKDIAELLDISYKTVETQISRSLKTLTFLLDDYL
ncbi:MAG: RNA polymerase sigma-70 factor [Balneolales bacterium]